MKDLQIEVVGDGEFRVHYNLNETDLSVTLAMILDEITSVDANKALEELAHYLNPEALDHLFQPLYGGRNHHPTAHLNVRIENCHVTIYNDGTIRISV